jgi:hypothetical protein
MIESGSLVVFLSSFFRKMGCGPSTPELIRRLRNICELDDLVPIDRDPDDPMWTVVPQIIMHRFGLSAFQSFNTRYKVARSFVFIHPANTYIVPKLKAELEQCWEVEPPIVSELTPELVCSLYGGYLWYDAYAKACEYRRDIGRLAVILPIHIGENESLKDLIAYKNANRQRLSDKIVVSHNDINTSMDGLIQAFHCPDLIENPRQMISIGLAERRDLYDAEAHYRNT